MGETQIRPLTGADFEAVVALDARITGQPRRGYFEKRLAAALRQPKRHLQLAAGQGAGLEGFLLARGADGEYGGSDRAVVLETLGVDPQVQRRGIGRRMLERLAELARARGAGILRSQADWRDHSLLRLFDRAGFQVAPRQVLERAVHRMAHPVMDVHRDAAAESAPPARGGLRLGHGRRLRSHYRRMATTWAARQVRRGAAGIRHRPLPGGGGRRLRGRVRHGPDRSRRTSAAPSPPHPWTPSGWTRDSRERDMPAPCWRR